GAAGEGKAAPPAKTLPGSAPLTTTGDMAAETVAGVDRFLLRELEGSIARRARHWKRDLSSPSAYSVSVLANRKRFDRLIGLGSYVPFDSLEFLAPTVPPEPVARAPGYEVWAVRWPVGNGTSGEGLLLEPAGHKPVARVVAIPDCAQTPEMLAGFSK